MHKYIITFVLPFCCTISAACGVWAEISGFENQLQNETSEYNKVTDELEYNWVKIRGLGAKGRYTEFEFDGLWQAKLSEGWLNRPLDRLFRRVNYMRGKVAECRDISDKRKKYISKTINDIDMVLAGGDSAGRDCLFRLYDLKDSFNELLAKHNALSDEFSSIHNALAVSDKKIELFNNEAAGKYAALEEMLGELNEAAAAVERVRLADESRTAKGFDLIFDDDGSFKIEKINRIFEKGSIFFEEDAYMPFDPKRAGVKNQLLNLESKIFADAEAVKAKISGSFAVITREFMILNIPINEFMPYHNTEVYSDGLQRNIYGSIRFKYKLKEGEISKFYIKVSKTDEWSEVLNGENHSSSGEFAFKWPLIAGKVYSPQVICESKDHRRSNPLIIHPVKFIFMGRLKNEIMQDTLGKFSDFVNGAKWDMLKTVLCEEYAYRDKLIEALAWKKKSLVDFELKYTVAAAQFSALENTADVNIRLNYKGALGAPKNINTKMLFKIEKNSAKICGIKNQDMLFKREVIPSQTFISEAAGGLSGGVVRSYHLHNLSPDGGLYGFDMDAGEASKSWAQSDLLCGYDAALFGSEIVDLNDRDIKNISDEQRYLFAVNSKNTAKPVSGNNYLLRTGLGAVYLLSIKEVNNMNGTDSSVKFDYKTLGVLGAGEKH